MKFKQVKTPKWANAEQTQIDCQVEWKKFPGRLMPFTASASDPAAHGRDLFIRLQSGEFGVVADYEPPVPPPAPEE
jgi:hypothetical protein